MAFMALAYPLLVAANILCALIWLWWRNKRILLPVVTILSGMAYLPGLFPLHSGATPNPDAGDIKLLTYNTRLFDLYGWYPGHTKRVDMLQMLQQEDADILCLQEYYYYDRINPEFQFNTRDTLLELISAQHYHEEFLFRVPDKFRTENIHRIGMATFSRFPIVNKGTLSFAEHTNNLALFTDLQIGNDTVRVYNIHLASVRLAKGEKVVAELLQEEEEGAAKRVVGKLRRAFERRAEQAEKLAAHIATSPHPVIMAGDFNDVPTSYAYNVLANGMEDAHEQAGLGAGNTYHEAFPGFRIDHILYQPQWEAIDCYTLTGAYSDHEPVVAWLRPAE